MTIDEGAARRAWMAYSIPLWKRAGRSDAWIVQNIQTEWASSKADILRRYAAGDFGPVPKPPPPPPPPKPTYRAPIPAPAPPYVAPKPQPAPAPSPISTPTKAAIVKPVVTPTITSTISSGTLAPKEEPKMTFEGIGITIAKAPITTSAIASTLISQASIPKPSSQDEARALMGWLFYSIPIWKRAGYTLTQMATATAVWKTAVGKADVIRRYKANDFAAVGFSYEPPHEIPEGPVYKEVRCPRGHLLRVRVRPPELRPGMTIPPPEWLRCPIDNTELGLSGYGTPQVIEGEPPAPYEPPTPPTYREPYEPPTPPTYREPYEPPYEPPPAPTPTEDARINEILDTYEQQIVQLEDAFDEARAAELYTNPYAIICQHGEALLTQMQNFAPISVTWNLQQKMRLQSLIGRLKNFIIDCRTAATQRKPLLTPTEAVQQTETDWISQYLQQSQQTGTPGLIQMYPVAGQYPVNGKPLVPTAATWSPASILRATEPQAMPEYSVLEKFAALTGQEDWQLAEAELAPAPSRLPYYIMGGLGLVGLVGLVAYIRKKKKRS